MSSKYNGSECERIDRGHSDGIIVGTSEIQFKGKAFLVPACKIEGYEVVATGRWLRMATLRDEEWLEDKAIDDPTRFVNALRASGLPADIFAYSGPIDGATIEGPGQIEIDNAAVVQTEDYNAWWESLSKYVRRNVTRSGKKGIEVRIVQFDDDFAAGIKAIYDETPVRQGRKFWHWGKDIGAVKRENASYLDRSEFIGAYYGGQLVGFMKLVYVGNAGHSMQILGLNAHRDKRPVTALIVKAAEICHKKGLKYLVYGKFTYGRKTDDGIVDFKRSLGFERKEFPRYYIPLTWRGRIALKLGAHKGWRGLLPPQIMDPLLKIRTWWLQKKLFAWPGAYLDRSAEADSCPNEKI